METHTRTLGQILENGLIKPFEPLVLQRSMKLFPTALGLEPLTPGMPSNDFLANFVSGRRTFLAIIRHGFGKDFKNFQNYALQKCETTTEVRQRLLMAVEGSEEILELLSSAMRDGVLITQFAKIIRGAEGLLYQMLQAASSGSVKCIHCQAELISRPAQWWSEQACELGEAEYRFVDRILYDILATTLLPNVFKSNWSQRKDAVVHLANLCDDRSHVFKNWLDLVRNDYRAKDLASLATRAGMRGPSPDSNLQRCARGDMLTFETIEEVTERLKDPNPLRILGKQARAVAFAIDFLVAADKSVPPLKWPAAQALMKNRILQLFDDLQLSITAGGLGAEKTPKRQS